MVVINLKYRFIVLALFCFHFCSICAQTSEETCCDYEFVEKNDSTIELRISINGISGRSDFYKDSIYGNFLLPSYQGRYKDCLLFMRGYGQHYRLLIAFQIHNKEIIRDDYEHSICMKPRIKESYLFFYKGQPIKMTYDYLNSKVKFKKMRNRKKYITFKGKTIESCNNKFNCYE